MLQHEFESLTGQKVTEEQFEVINARYMLNDDETKGEFCNRYKAMSKEELLNEWVKLNAKSKEYSHGLKKQYEEARNRAESAELEIKRLQKLCEHWMGAWEKASDQLAAIAEILKGGAE